MSMYISFNLPLKCANKQDFVAMMKVALNCECKGLAKFCIYFCRKISAVTVIVSEFRKFLL